MKSLFIIFCLLFFVSQSFSQPGTLDKSFGDEGIVIGETPVGAIRSIIIQKDGKIVAGMEGFILQRFNTDGSLDSSFGINGTVTTVFPGTTFASLRSISLLADDKILAGGGVYSSTSDIGLARYKSDGTLDSSFGLNGLVVTDLGVDEAAYDMAVSPDGKIVVAGKIERDYNDIDRACVVRYNPDGSPDESFGAKGAIIHVYDAPIEITSVAVQTDDKILIAGRYDFLSAFPKFMVTRFLKDGKPDETFGTSGVATLGFNDEAIYGTFLYDMAIQLDGKIVTCGMVSKGKNNMVVARFESNGEVDLNFGKTGYTITEFENSYSEIRSVLLKSDGNIIGTGGIYESNGGNGDFALIQYKQNGTPDSSFATNGLSITEVEGNARIYDAILQEDGKIVVGGSTFISSPAGTYPALARYIGTGDEQPPLFVKIKKWLHRHGFTWDDWPGNNKISYYSVQRSGNGSAFTEIARLFRRNDGQQQYSYEDAAPLAGNNYYRLAAVSADGSTAYSNTLAINNTAGSTVKIYPNPAKNNLQIEGLSAAQKTKLTVTDFSGIVKASAVVTGSSYNLNTAQLKPGNYILRIESNGNAVTKKFIKE